MKKIVFLILINFTAFNAYSMEEGKGQIKRKCEVMDLELQLSDVEFKKLKINQKSMFCDIFQVIDSNDIYACRDFLEYYEKNFVLDWSILDKNGLNPLYYALKNGNQEIIKFIIAYDKDWVNRLQFTLN